MQNPERYTAEETSEIYKIIHENNDLPYSTERLNDYIAVLVAHRDKMNEKSVTAMSEDELRKFADSIKNKKHNMFERNNENGRQQNKRAYQSR